jgi:PKD repeat protein
MSSFDSQTLYAGYRNVWKTTDGGTTWNQISNFGIAGEIERLELCEADPNVIYASIYISGFPSEIHLFKTTDGGNTWQDFGQGIPFSSGSITAIEVSPTDPNKLWLARGTRIFYTENGAKSWINYSGTLPTFPIYDIEYQEGSADRIFVGTRIGVYYRDNTQLDWQSWNLGLPNVEVRALEVHAPSQKLRAGTYGRGIWETDLPDFTAAPTAQFHTPRREVCPGVPVEFINRSKGMIPGGTYSWTFPGGTPATSNAVNPVVTYTAIGTYAATLTITTANGTHTLTQPNWITVTDATSETLPYVQDFEVSTFPPTGWKLVNPDLDFTWTRYAGGISGISGPGTDVASIYMDIYGRYRAGTHDLILTPEFDFGPFSGGTLTFDVGYCMYDTFSNDTLNIWFSTDCGETLQPLYAKGRQDLATFPNSNIAFGPISPDRWRIETVDLSPLANRSNVTLIFDARAWGGNNLWVDNINIVSGGLKVELSAFDAWRAGSNAQLQWVAASETAGSGFVVERKTLEGNFEGIGTVPGGKPLGTPYFFTDNAPLPGLNHYRLRMLDQEGNSEYSIIRTVRFDETYQSFTGHYASQAQAFALILETGIAANTTIEIFTVDGKVLLAFEWEVEVGRNTLQIPTSYWSTGLYYIRLSHPKEGSKTIKIPKW